MRAVVVLLLLAAFSANADSPRPELPPPMSIEELREHDFDSELVFERPLDDGESFSAYLVSYEHAGLTLHAMVAVPEGDMPDDGFPIVIANHGYVPEPRNYGITGEGVDARPGDYYRAVPELFASRGFIVVMPDYRGHNSSEGYEYTQLPVDRAIEYYAEDVVSLMAALDGLEDADLERVFMWSHSMGGPVSLRALLATDIVRAASFWSTMSTESLDAYIHEFDVPIIIQHQIGDPTTPVENSQRFAQSRRTPGVPRLLSLTSGEDHFFTGTKRAEAANKDAEYFRSHAD